MKYTCKKYKIGRTTRHLNCGALTVALESKNNTIKTTHNSQKHQSMNNTRGLQLVTA